MITIMRHKGLSLPLAMAAIVSIDSGSNPALAQWPVAPIWTGVYAGIHGAQSWSDVDTNRPRSFLDDTSTQFGGHLGFNLSLGLILLGIEGDLNIENTQGRMSVFGGDTFKYDADMSGTLRGRLGIPIGPALIYATAGYAWLDLGAHYTSSAGFRTSGTETIDGIVYGIGAEMSVLPSLSVRLEALQFDYQTQDLSLGATNLEFDPSSTVVRAGVSFRFN